ncbi:MAG: FtsQ-type POTRA domain-containing protein [Clostridiales bacterium]|nr:FtsQ-type POTRA domain-containing protein [Clostridiales bacterium]
MSKAKNNIPQNRQRSSQSGRSRQARADTAELSGLKPPQRSSQQRGQQTPAQPRSSRSAKSQASGQRTTRTGAPVSRQEQRKAQYLRRRKKIRRRKIFLYSSMLLVVLGVAAALCLTVFFRIDTVEITGMERYTQEEVERVANVQMDASLLLLKTGEIRSDLERLLPYIETAEIKRSLPGKVQIQIQESEASAYIAQDDAYLLLNENLKILETVADLPEGLMEIQAGAVSNQTATGEQVQFEEEALQESLESLLELAEESGFSGITGIYLDSDTSNRLVYQGRIQVQLGHLSDLEYKLSFARENLKELDETSPSAKGILDVSLGKRAYFTEEY